MRMYGFPLNKKLILRYQMRSGIRDRRPTWSWDQPSLGEAPEADSCMCILKLWACKVKLKLRVRYGDRCLHNTHVQMMHTRSSLPEQFQFHTEAKHHGGNTPVPLSSRWSRSLGISYLSASLSILLRDNAAPCSLSNGACPLCSWLCSPTSHRQHPQHN